RSTSRIHIYTGQRRSDGPDQRSLARQAFVPPSGFKVRGLDCALWCWSRLRTSPSGFGDQAARPLFSPLDKRETSFLQALRKASISAAVVSGPRLTRIAPPASPGSAPMAARTWEAVTFPDEQADPDETAMPSRSRAIRAVSALHPGTANSVVFGSRSAAA